MSRAVIARKWRVCRFGTSRLLHVKISSSAHLQRRGLGQDAKNWQDLWDVLKSSFQCEISELRGGTYYFKINLNVWQHRFCSIDRETKTQSLQVDVWAPFQRLQYLTQHNLKWLLNKLSTISLYYWTFNAPYQCLWECERWRNELQNCSPIMVIRIRGTSQRINHFFHVMFTPAQLPWPCHHPKHLTNNLRLPQELPVHPNDANSRHLTVCKVL